MRAHGHRRHTGALTLTLSQRAREPVGDEFLEARQRLGFAVRIEEFVAGDAAIGIEDEEAQERPLECAAALATHARGQPTQQQGVVGQREHILWPRHHLVADLSPRGHRAEQRIQPDAGAKPK